MVMRRMMMVMMVMVMMMAEVFMMVIMRRRMTTRGKGIISALCPPGKERCKNITPCTGSELQKSKLIQILHFSCKTNILYAIYNIIYA